MWTVAMVGLFVIVGLTSGLWIQIAIMAVTMGIFYATVSLRRAEKPQPSGGQVVSLRRYGLDSVEDLDEVA